MKPALRGAHQKFRICRNEVPMKLQTFSKFDFLTATVEKLPGGGTFAELCIPANMLPIWVFSRWVLLEPWYWTGWIFCQSSHWEWVYNLPTLIYFSVSLQMKHVFLPETTQRLHQFWHAAKMCCDKIKILPWRKELLFWFWVSYFWISFWQNGAFYAQVDTLYLIKFYS